MNDGKAGTGPSLTEDFSQNVTTSGMVDKSGGSSIGGAEATSAGDKVDCKEVERQKWFQLAIFPGAQSMWGLCFFNQGCPETRGVLEIILNWLTLWILDTAQTFFMPLHIWYFTRIPVCFCCFYTGVPDYGVTYSVSAIYIFNVMKLQLHDSADAFYKPLKPQIHEVETCGDTWLRREGETEEREKERERRKVLFTS